MHCPVCDHVSDKALLRCAACESTFEREALAELEHLAYLQQWLTENIPDTGQRAALAAQIAVRRHTLLLQMRVPAARQRHALQKLSPAERQRVRACGQALQQILPAWRADPALATAADALADALAMDRLLLADLPDASPPLPDVTCATAFQFALGRLATWADTHGWSTDVTDALRTRLQQAPAQPVATPAQLRELAFLQAARSEVVDWRRSELIWPGLADNLLRLLDDDIATLQRATGASSPPRPAPAAVVEFLLASLPQWKATTLMGDSELARLRNHLQSRQAEPLPVAITHPVDQAPAAQAATAPAPAPAARTRRPLPRPRLPRLSWRDLRQRLAAAAESGALMSGFLYVNAFAIVIAAAVLVTRFPDRFPLWAQISFIAAVPTVFYLFGWIIRARIRLVQSGSILTNIGALLVAVDLAGIYSFGGLAGRVDAGLYWLLASLFCALLYAVTGWRLRSEFTGYATLLAAISALVAATTLPDGLSGWSAAAAALGGAAMLLPATRLQRPESALAPLGRAAERLPLALLPITQLAVFLLSRPVRWEPTVTFLLATAGYAGLTRIYATRRRGGPLLAHATVWSSVAALALALVALNPPAYWIPPVLAVAAPLYLFIERLLNEKMAPDLPGRRARRLAPLLAGGVLLLAGFVGGIAALDPAGVANSRFWLASSTLLLTGVVLAAAANAYRRPWLLFGGGLLVVYPATALVNVLLLAGRADAAVWIGVSWAAFGLLYLLAGTTLRRRLGTLQLHLLAQLLLPLSIPWLATPFLLDTSSWYPWPVLVGLLLLLAGYAIAAILENRGDDVTLTHMAAAVGGQQPGIFLLPVLALLPFVLAVAWSIPPLSRAWLGPPLAVLALAYVPAGQLLQRHRAGYRVIPHLFAYVIPAAGVLLALDATWPLVATTLCGVLILAALSHIYNRVAETAAAGLLFLWPFQLLLRELGLPDHAYALAYALLGGLFYRALAQLPAPAGGRIPWRTDRQESPRSRLTPRSWTLLALGAALTGTAVLASSGLWLTGSGYIPWIGVAVPLIGCALFTFDTYNLRRPRYATVATLLAAVTFGMGLNLLRVPPAYQPLAWIGLGGAALLLDHRLGSRDGWMTLFRVPLTVSSVLAPALGVLFLTLDVITLFAGYALDDYLPLILSAGLLTLLSILAARLHWRRRPLLVAPPAALVAVTAAFAGYAPRLFEAPVDAVDYAPVWAVLAVVYLVAGLLLDHRPRARTHQLGHVPFLAGYGLLPLAVFWGVGSGPITTVTLGVSVAALALSQVLFHAGRLPSYGDLIDRLPADACGRGRRVAATGFLSLTALLFPIWLGVALSSADVAWAGRGLALTLCAPLYVALGLQLRRARADYRWPLYLMGYLLSGLGPLLALGDRPLLIASLSATMLLLGVSAIIFRQAGWLYLAGALAPVVGGLTLAQVGRFERVWLAGLLLGLAVIYLTAGYLLDRRDDKVLSRYGKPPAALGYILSAVGLAAGSSGTLPALVVYLVGAAIYALSARRFRAPLFLYPVTGLVSVAYWLGLSLTPLDARWYGIALLPLLVAGIATGRWAFARPPAITGRQLRRRLGHAAMPFYLPAYGLSVAMILLSLLDTVTLTVALGAAALLYVVSAALFRRAAWLTPALLSGHLAVAAGLGIVPSDSPAHAISVPFMLATWLVALAALLLDRLLPPVQRVDLGPWPFTLRSWRWQLGGWPFLNRLRTPAWSQPLWWFVAADLLIWLTVSTGGTLTGLRVSLGFLLLLALLATLWQDEGTAFGAAALGALALTYGMTAGSYTWTWALALLSGAGLAYYLLARLLELLRPYAPPLDAWPRPLSSFGILLASGSALVLLPQLGSATLTVAAALGFTGVLYLTAGVRNRLHAPAYGGAALINIAWALLLFDQAVDQPQLYALPAGLYFLGLGFFERRRGRATFANYLDGFGAAVILLTSFIQSVQLDGGRPYFLLLIPEALLILAWGALRRNRVTFIAGMVGFAVNVIGQLVVLSIVDDILRWIIIFAAAVVATALVVALQWEWQRNFEDVKAWRDIMGKWS